MAMKPIAVFVIVAALAVGTLAAGAKTVTSSQGNSNDTSVAAVAGPTAAAKASHSAPDKMAGLSAKKKAKTRTARAQKPASTAD